MSSSLTRNYRSHQRGLATQLQRRNTGAMPTVQITSVPEETHAVLRQRAARAHQSLQEYLLGLLVREAKAPTVDEVLERAARRTGGSLSFPQAIELVLDDRHRR